MGKTGEDLNEDDNDVTRTSFKNSTSKKVHGGALLDNSNVSKYSVGKLSLAYDKVHEAIGEYVGDYFVHWQDSYIHLNNRTKKDRSATTLKDRRGLFARQKLESIGWKLHISVHAGQVAEAWSIIYPILIDYKLTGIKILDPKRLEAGLKQDKKKVGINSKQFTIYYNRNQDLMLSQWQEIIHTIELELIRKKITPGTLPRSNKAILGSVYFSYRNDEGPNQSYISDENACEYVQRHGKKHPHAKAYNLCNYPDPFESIECGESRSLCAIDNSRLSI